jgi:hypothetical protein
MVHHAVGNEGEGKVLSVDYSSIGHTNQTNKAA